MRLAAKHEWGVNTAEARRIQEELREKWEGADRLGAMQTVAGLDAAFVIKGSQAMKRGRGRSAAMPAANLAIAGVVVYQYPEMEELERGHAEVRLEFPYVGLLSFREIPALLAALDKLWGGLADEGERETGLCFPGASGFAGDGFAADAVGC